MALINCPECGKEISDKAPSCPQCGNPVGAVQREEPQDQLRCPKCNSTNLTTNDKGFSLGKAAVGGVLLGGVGLLAGAHGGKRIRINCLKCGHSWVPFDEAKKAENAIIQKKTNKVLMWIGVGILILFLLSALNR